MVVPRLTSFALACLTLVLITTVCASAGTIYTTPGSDGYTWYYDSPQAEPEQGVNTTDSYVYVVDGEHMGGSTYEREVSRAFFWFPISSLSGVTLMPNSAKLHPYFRSNTAARGLDLRGYTYDYGGTGGTLDITYFTPTASTWGEFDVTAYLQGQINAGYAWAGFSFTARYALDDFRTVYISTYEDSAHRPYLDVIPEPSSLFALGSGLIGLLGLVRRRR